MPKFFRAIVSANAGLAYLCVVFNNVTMEDTQGYVRIATSQEGAAEVRFYHPAHNSLPAALLQALADAFEALGGRSDVKVIVLRSDTHKTFCAGASFDELVAIDDAQTAHRFFSGFGSVINAMRRCPKIIVGRIHGKASGVG